MGFDHLTFASAWERTPPSMQLSKKEPVVRTTGMLRALDLKQKDPLPPINQRLSRLTESMRQLS
jgi:hypothetical protein